jgi:hypothetical protein
MSNKIVTTEHTEFTETRKGLNELTEIVIGCAIEVHRALGPGLLESTYDMCLAQLLSYLKLSGVNVGLLINFNVRMLKEGVRRKVLGPVEEVSLSLRVLRDLCGEYVRSACCSARS